MGDIVLLQAGERVPVDGILISGELTVDQSALNVESKEERKYPDIHCRAIDRVPDFMSPGRIFRGSAICSGEGVMGIEYVRDNTFYGRLAMEIQEETIESPLKTRLGDLARTLSIFGYIAAMVVMAANLFSNIIMDNHFNPVQIAAYLGNRSYLTRDILKAVTLGITIIVMAVPEGLPMMMHV